MLTRQQLSDYFNQLQHGLGAPDSPLWQGDCDTTAPCQFFICVSPMNISSSNITTEYPEGKKKYFWNWVHKNLKGEIRCFSSGDGDEWWGFTDCNDIAWFLLRWSQ